MEKEILNKMIMRQEILVLDLNIMINKLKKERDVFVLNELSALELSYKENKNLNYSNKEKRMLVINENPEYRSMIKNIKQKEYERDVLMIELRYNLRKFEYVGDLK